jgi:phage terminase small subunit
LKHVEVARAVAEAQGDRVERTEVTQDYVLENLTETVERCMQRAPVMVRRGRNVVQLQDADGRNVWQFDARGAVQALNLLGKHLAMFSENVNLRTPDGPIEVAVTRKVIGSHNRVAAYTNGNGANGKP